MTIIVTTTGVEIVTPDGFVPLDLVRAALTLMMMKPSRPLIPAIQIEQLAEAMRLKGVERVEPIVVSKRPTSIARRRPVFSFVTDKRDNTVCAGCGGCIPPGRAGRKCRSCRN